MKENDVRAIPTLVVFDQDGKLLSKECRSLEVLTKLIIK
jgi:hypothetical protein